MHSGPVKPVPPPVFVWVSQPLYPCPLLPQGLPGLLLINCTPYLVSVHGDGK